MFGGLGLYFKLLGELEILNVVFKQKKKQLKFGPCNTDQTFCETSFFYGYVPSNFEDLRTLTTHTTYKSKLMHWQSAKQLES